MAEELPSEYDAIILGTGLPESVVAAALARVGYKVLHLDRNDYYSGYWASFSFESLQEWIKQNCEQETEDVKVFEGSPGEVCLLKRGNAITNIEVRSYLRNEDQHSKDVNTSCDVNEEIKQGSDPSGRNAEKNVDVSENVIPTEPELVADFNFSTSETNKDRDTSCNSNNDDEQSLTSTGDQTCESLEDESSSVSVASNVEQRDLSYVTGSTDRHESENRQEKDTKEPSEEAPEVQNHLSSTEKRKMRDGKNLDKKSTYKDFLKKSRKFNLDLFPKVLFSRGLLVESLISANISHYAEFKVVSRILIYVDGKVEEVPCSRSDVFGSELINVLEKRSLMRFMTFCTTFEDCPEEYESFKDKPFVNFLKSRKLSTNLQQIILNAIAVVHENTSTYSGLKATQKFLRSLGRYGNTPFLWSLYGAGELPQAFCRMCAVFGGIYCLRKNVKSLVLDGENKNCVAVISEDGQRLNTKWLVMEKSYAPDVFEVVTQNVTSRAILITDRSLRPAVREHISVLTLPSRSNQSPVRVIELPPSSMACPECLFVVHLTTEAKVNAFEDLNCYVKDLFTTQDAPDCDNEKPVVLWSVYFNVDSGALTKTDKLPSNVKLTLPPSAKLDFEDAMIQAKDIFTSICPNEDFLPAVPNPEDIIWDDIGSNSDTTEEPSKLASYNVVSGTDQKYSEGLSNENNSVQTPKQEADTSDMIAGEMVTCGESQNTKDSIPDNSIDTKE